MCYFTLQKYTILQYQHCNPGCFFYPELAIIIIFNTDSNELSQERLS